jgi:flagellar protein FlaJ
MASILALKADNRTRFIEEMIPDFLRLLSSNIRSGFTIDKALLLSARPEFGQLEKEIRQAAKETISGESTENALRRLVKKFNSDSLKRSIDLLTEGILKGGNLPDLLDNLAEDLRQIKTLRKEVKAIVMMYVIFIFFAAGIGAPLLYSVSGFLVSSMGQIGGQMQEKPIPGNIPFVEFNIAQVDPGFLDFYAMLSILITSVFGSMLIGLVQEGKERAGIKFLPILLFLSLGIYFASKTLLGSMFGAALLP